MKGSTLFRLSLCALFLVTIACSGEDVTADGAATPAEAAGDVAGSTTPAATAPASSDPAADPENSFRTRTVSTDLASEVPLVAPSANPAEIKATVNGVPIVLRDLNLATTLYAQSQRLPANLNQEQVDEVRRVVMEGLIDRELLYQKSVKDGVKPGGTAVDELIAQAREPFPTEEAWLAHLGAQGVKTNDAYRNLVIRSMSIEGVVKTAMGSASLSAADIKKYFDEHPEEMKSPEQVRASHILFRYPEGKAAGAMAAAKAKAEETLVKLKAGEDFAELARNVSNDPVSGKNGGDLGFFPRGRMVPAFDQVAFTLEPGKLSDIFETPFGWHIMKVVEKQPERQATFDEVKENLGKFLAQKTARDGLANVVQKLRSDAQIRMF
jgi:peptidyl-prolyl cis-trans isomerase C